MKKLPKFKEIKGPWISDKDKYDERISETKQYFACIKDYGWVVGEFSKVWYGWSFNDGLVMHQFDHGQGCEFKALYEIVGAKP